MSDHQRRLSLAQLVRSCIRSKAFIQGGVSTALALGAIAISPVVSAQAAPTADDTKENAENIQEVVVTGLRRSLETVSAGKKTPAKATLSSAKSDDAAAKKTRKRA